MDEDGGERRVTDAAGGRHNHEHESHVLQVNTRALRGGGLAILGALGVIMFPESNAGPAFGHLVGKTHAVAACTFFFGTYWYLCQHCWLDNHAVVEGISSARMRKFRFVLCLIEGLGFAGLFISGWCKATKCDTTGSVAYQAVSFFEVATFLAFMVHLLSWVDDFAKVEIIVTMRNKSEPGVEVTLI